MAELRAALAAADKQDEGVAVEVLHLPLVSTTLGRLKSHVQAAFSLNMHSMKPFTRVLTKCGTTVGWRKIRVPHVLQGLHVFQLFVNAFAPLQLVVLRNLAEKVWICRRRT